ncbi:peptide/nickel transport system ATP-binding protein/glutathione transport system ATP-binding protein [Rathayibacter sp. PhB127]|uniref:ABC transporter ATP-binding protein n=1 Tax=Rathayibacter sp. PhB127 TaxID=2485176 RepID=UPI000F4BB513|nr:ABC transporter ATP-binding protein [Rathayibacter sp. PhB127]ROS28370.1 peptide/nickel transport system ATP-binding protein/glutathione transport system ATP-binding protein [Rathayibacter sp. PhB127]
MTSTLPGIPGAPGVPVLSVRDLVIEAGPKEAPVRLVDGIGFDVLPGEVVAIVGESGSGKSMTMLSTMGLLPRGVRVAGGEILLGGVDLRTIDQAALRSIRGRSLSMIFQDPMTSLNPVMRIGTQIAEMITLHEKGLTRAQVRDKALRLLELVHLPDPERRLRAYPHELSGGQRQRVMIAMAIAHEPGMLIADEPTTALDVTVQAQVMSVLQEVRERLSSSLVLVTHDLGLVAENADRVLVMHQGRIVESGTTLDVFRDPQDDYTKRLLASILPVTGREARAVEPVVHAVEHPHAEPVVEVSDVRVHFPQRGAWGRSAEPFRAVDGVSFRLEAGRTLGLVGESGCGKSTLVRTILGMQKPTSGSVSYRGTVVSELSDRARRPLRASIQAVFQDPYSSLDPRLTVHEIVAEPLRINRVYSAARVAEVLEQVGLTRESASRRPADFSGGQRQRVGIARALALKPDVLVLDEPTSALDVSIQAQVMALLTDLQSELRLAYLFVSHDLSVVRALADDVAVMHRGLLVETGPTAAVFDDPQHAYTRSLLASAPVPDPTRRRRSLPAAA